MADRARACAGCGMTGVFGVFCCGCMAIVSLHGPWWLHRKVARGNDRHRTEGIAQAVDIIHAAKGMAPTLLEVGHG